MSTPDTVTVECELPDDAPQWLKDTPVFQTRDLGDTMSDYRITKDRELVLDRTPVGCIVRRALGVDEKAVRSTPVQYANKRIELYATNIRGGKRRKSVYCYFTEHGEPACNITYRVWIRKGKAGPIREKSRSLCAALPMSEFQKGKP